MTLKIPLEAEGHRGTVVSEDRADNNVSTWDVGLRGARGGRGRTEQPLSLPLGGRGPRPSGTGPTDVGAGREAGPADTIATAAPTQSWSPGNAHHPEEGARRRGDCVARGFFGAPGSRGGAGLRLRDQPDPDSGRLLGVGAGAVPVASVNMPPPRPQRV